MKYVTAPSEVRIEEIRANDYIFSPGRYVKFQAPKPNSNCQFASLDKLVVLRNSKIKAEKTTKYHYAEIGDVDVSTGAILWREMHGYYLPSDRPQIARQGDILISTVRTYRNGIAYVDSSAPNLVTTGAFLNIGDLTNYAPQLTKLYLYSFLRSEFFSEQVWSMLNRGVYPRMDADALHQIQLPVVEDSRVIAYISALMQAMMDKERAIRARNQQILQTIENELDAQQTTPFVFDNPTIHEIRRVGRLDAALYSKQYKSVLHSIEKYKYGSTNPEADGFDVIPGPSLEIKLLRVRVDASEPRAGFYALILPTNISDNGTLIKTQYLGTPKKLPLLQNGDIVFGESGCHRSLVLIDVKENCTTNAHGIYARRSDGNLTKSIFLRCFYDWLDKRGIIDLLSVGGNGGHFSPEYFSSLPIPKFPDAIQADIAQLYHNPTPAPSTVPTLEDFVEWHRSWNEDLGIWELDREMKSLQSTLREVQDEIIRGKTVSVPFA